MNPLVGLKLDYAHRVTLKSRLALYSVRETYKLRTDERLRIRATGDAVNAERLPVNFRRREFDGIPSILHLKS